MSYNIKTVAELTGIPRNTLLAWERRYSVVSPDREDNGYRLYTDEDVERLKAIKGLVDAGHRVSEAIRLLERDQVPASPGRVGEEEGVEALKAALTDALLAFDRAGADELRRRMTLLPFESLIQDIYLPVMCDIGELWEAGQATVAQEHFASAFVREQLIGMLQNLASGPRGGRRVLCAGLEGEDHELGLLGVAVRMALRGWRVTYLGANLPLEELATVAWEHRPELVCQSVVRPRDKGELLAYGHSLRQRCPPECLVVIGGAGVSGLASNSARGLMFAPTFQDLIQVLDAPVKKGRGGGRGK